LVTQQALNCPGKFISISTFGQQARPFILNELHDAAAAGRDNRHTDCYRFDDGDTERLMTDRWVNKYIGFAEVIVKLRVQHTTNEVECSLKLSGIALWRQCKLYSPPILETGE
jgi:hypothetical protein